MNSAKHTMLFADWVSKTKEGTQSTYGALLTNYIEASVFSSMANDLMNMLGSVYRYYECGSDDDDEMLQYMKDVFDEYRDYYYEIITNYQKEYNYALNNKRVTTKIDDLTIAGSSKVDSEDKRSSVDYELPNKVIDEEKFRSTPSRINDNDGNAKQEKSYDNNTNRTSTHTVEFNNEFIDLKNKYMRQIRNVFHEFAMKFKECFYQVY